MYDNNKYDNKLVLCSLTWHYTIYDIDTSGNSITNESPK